MSWFLLGGDMYTAYSFIAVPGLIFSTGALGFFAVPYLTIIYPLLFLVLPKLWAVSRHRGYVTSADFVRERFDSPLLALLIAIVGICATMPYIALQIYGMEILLTVMGVPTEIALFIAFAVLAIYTYISGLRAPALIAIVKDICIWTVTIVAMISITTRLGGFSAIFAAVHQKALVDPSFHDVLPASSYTEFVTLALGSAFALLLYPHNLTGVLSTNSGKVVKRNAALLPIYTILLVMIGLLGYEAIAANIQISPTYGANAALPDLLLKMFPSWFSGFAFATISVGALVPAAIMSIAAANLFTRNIYREFLRPHCNEREEASVAKTASLIVKFGALAVILWLPAKLAINFQLFSNFLIIQTLPVIFIGLYTRWFHKYALMIGIVAGLTVGMAMAIAEKFASVYPFVIAGVSIPVYIAIAALIVNSIPLRDTYSSVSHSGNSGWRRSHDPTRLCISSCWNKWQTECSIPSIRTCSFPDTITGTIILGSRNAIDELTCTEKTCDTSQGARITTPYGQLQRPFGPSTTTLRGKCAISPLDRCYDVCHKRV